MRRTLIAGNWKMNGSLESIGELMDGIKAGLNEVSNADIAVCPPAIYLMKVRSLIEANAFPRPMVAIEPLSL